MNKHMKASVLVAVAAAALCVPVPALAQVHGNPNFYSPAMPVVTHESVLCSGVASTTFSIAAGDTFNAATGSIALATVDTYADTPRNVWIFLHDQSQTAGTAATGTLVAKVVITGLNQWGVTVTDTITSAAEASGDTVPAASKGKVAFSKVTSIAWTLGAGNTDSGDEIGARWGDKLGVVTPMGAAGDCFLAKDTADGAGSTDITATVTVSPRFGTIQPASITAKDRFDFWIKTTNLDTQYWRRSSP